MGEASRLVKNTAVIALGGSFTKLLQFFLLPLYTAVLTTAEYGTVDFVTVLVTFLVPISTLLIDESLFRFLIDCKTEFDSKKVVTTSLVVMGLGCAVIAVVVIPIVHVTRFEYGLWLVLYTYSTTALAVASAVLRGFGKTAAYSLMNFIAGFLTIALNVVFIVALGWGVVGMLSASIIAQFSASVIFLMRAGLPSLVYLESFDKGMAGKMIKYSAPLIPTKVSWAVMNLSSRLVIMPVMGPSAAGLYALAYKFPSVMDMVFGFFFQSWKESSARVLSEGREATERFYLRVHSELQRVMASIVILMVPLMPFAFHLMVDKAYAGAIQYVPILLLATYFSNMSGFVGGVFTAFMDTRVMGTSTLVSAAVNLALNVLLIPLLGLWGASISTLTATFLVYAHRLIKVKKYVAFKYVSKTEIVCLLVFLIVGAFFYFGNSIAIAVACLGSFVFAAVLNRRLILRSAGMMASRAKRKKR